MLLVGQTENDDRYSPTGPRHSRPYPPLASTLAVALRTLSAARGDATRPAVATSRSANCRDHQNLQWREFYPVPFGPVTLRPTLWRDSGRPIWPQGRDRQTSREAIC